MKNIVYVEEAVYGRSGYSLEEALDLLEQELCTRTITGNEAIKELTYTLENLSKEDAIVLERIINRDLKVNVGKTQVNKVWKNLITKPPYTRCEIGTNENILKIMPIDKDGNFINKVYSQIKMDGTFRRAVKDTEIEITSRPGIETKFPLIEEQLKSLNIEDVVFIGEMTLRDEQDRSKGNGIINSKDIPHEDVLFTVWDMIPIHEYSMSKDEIKKAEKEGILSLYEDRLEKLSNVLVQLDNIELIEYKIVKNMKEAYEHFRVVTERGDEGTVLKSYDMTHKDGNSKKQLKIKLVIDLDMRITGFNAGNKGSKNEDYFSGINYSNDEGTIKGSIGVTTMTEKERDWFHLNREEVIGNVMEIHCNDITTAEDNDYYALSHPRYISLRGKDKITNTYERAMEQKQMAMELK